MAVVAVTFDGTILSEAENASDNGVWDKFGASQDPAQETNFLFQRATAQSNKASNAIAGVEFEDDATVDFTTPKVVLAKVMVATPGLIDITTKKGCQYDIGEGTNGGSWNYSYYLFGLYAGAYPLLKTWLVIAIDPNEEAWYDDISGTPDLTTTDYYGFAIDANALSKSENVIHDRLDYMTSGTGLTLVGGDSTDPDGTLDDFLAQDFETQANRYGVVLPGEAEVIVNGVLTIGTSTATVYNDSNRFLVFPHHRVGVGFSGLDIGMSNASNDINLTNYTLKGLGNVSNKLFFDSELDVDGTNEEIDIIAHGLITGDYVLYSDEGGTAVSGLTDATSYYVNAVTVDSISLHAFAAGVGRITAYEDTDRIDLTAAGSGQNHSIIRHPDTRPDHTVTGTTGVGNTWNSCTIDSCRILTFTSKSTMTGGFILNTGNIVLSTGAMESIAISAATLEEGDALFSPLTTFANLTDMSFTAGAEGHAIRMTTADSQGWEHTLSGYWEPDDLGWNFSTAQSFASEEINTDANHGFTTGDAVYYNDEGGAVGIGLSNTRKYYVNVVDADTVTVHVTKSAAIAGTSAVDLTTSGSETHSLYSSKAAVFNDTSSGTLTIGVTGGNAPSFRNADGATTVVNVSVPITITVKDVNGDPIENVITGVYLTSDRTEIINEDTNASGIADGTYSGTTPDEVEVRCRKASSADSPRYIAFSTVQTLASGTGLTLAVTLVEDPNNNAQT